MYRASADTSGDESEVIKACKICLTTEGKLQKVSGEERHAYRNLTGVEWITSDRLPQHICVECGARLRGTVCLRRKALVSRKLLDKILTLEASVTSSHIHLADRARRKLQSNLRTMHFTPISYLAGVPVQCDKQTITNDNDFLEIPGIDPIENVECVIISDDSDTNSSSKFENEDTRPANDAYDTGSSEIVAVDVETQTDDYDSDSSEGKRLVIDVEEPMQNVLSSEYIGDSRGGMPVLPVDELIDLYNNDGDGDARLQELNEHFGGGGTIRIDLGWGANRDAGDRLRVRAVRDAPVPAPAPRGGEPRQNSAKHFNMTCGACNHQKVHEGTIFKCAHCPSQFKKEATYKNHVRRRHVKASICAICGFPFAGDRGLAVHRGMMHPDAHQVPLLGPYCGLCDVVFASLNAYANHLSMASPHAPGFSHEALLMLPRGSELNETHE